MEKILSITEVTNKEFNGYDHGDGYEITTDKQVILLLISNEQDCCENWGYFMSEDDVQNFVGAYMDDVTLTDTALNTSKMTEVYEGDIMFVNIVTNKGVLQFVAYNEHNGYYGHSVYVKSEQLTRKTVL